MAAMQLFFESHRVDANELLEVFAVFIFKLKCARGYILLAKLDEGSGFVIGCVSLLVL